MNAIRGHLLGDVNVRVELESTEARASFRVRPINNSGESVVASTDRRVTRYIGKVHAAIEAENYRNRAIVPVSKPGGAKRRKRQPEPVLCPDCHGVRSFDCDTCDGAGVVPS